MQLTAVNTYPRSKRQRTGIDNDRLFGIVQHSTEFHHLLIRNEGYGAYASRPFASYVYHETFDIRKMHDLLPTQDIGATDEYNGDGELTAGKLLKLLAESGKKMSELNGIYEQYPQVLVNVTANAAQKAAYKEDEVLAGFIENEQQKLMGMGRVLVRVSGTEPKLRVMVEGQDLEAIHRCADRIVEKINKRILKQ